MDHKPADARSVGERFTEFAIGFFNLAKNSYHQQNQVRANSAAFHLLVRLKQPERPCPTMSEMAGELGITKQQLTKLVNDLEQKDLVSRQHDCQNRRQVYLKITPQGSAIMGQLREAMLNCTVSRLSVYTQEELEEMDDCLKRLGILLDKFPVDSDGQECRNFPQ